jgi:hypothetical protein
LKTFHETSSKRTAPPSSRVGWIRLKREKDGHREEIVQIVTKARDTCRNAAKSIRREEMFFSDKRMDERTKMELLGRAIGKTLALS